mmetsp:Transcript_34382/g.63209  ORF Transcript_34382/g.63209 Transcript_34382/m.63209 type:complete len:264 (+) Transcript_34382:471-1262(+)
MDDISVRRSLFNNPIPGSTFFSSSSWARVYMCCKIVPRLAPTVGRPSSPSTSSCPSPAANVGDTEVSIPFCASRMAASFMFMLRTVKKLVSSRPSLAALPIMESSLRISPLSNNDASNSRPERSRTSSTFWRAFPSATIWISNSSPSSSSSCSFHSPFSAAICNATTNRGCIFGKLTAMVVSIASSAFSALLQAAWMDCTNDLSSIVSCGVSRVWDASISVMSAVVVAAADESLSSVEASVVWNSLVLDEWSGDLLLNCASTT